MFSKLWAPFGYGLYYSTSYLGIPKWDPNFGNYPHGEPLRSGKAGVLARNNRNNNSKNNKDSSKNNDNSYDRNNTNSNTDKC